MPSEERHTVGGGGRCGGRYGVGGVCGALDGNGKEDVVTMTFVDGHEVQVDRCGTQDVEHILALIVTLDAFAFDGGIHQVLLA